MRSSPVEALGATAGRISHLSFGPPAIFEKAAMLHGRDLQGLMTLGGKMVTLGAEMVRWEK